MIKTVHGVEEVIDFIWELNQKDLYASYPRITSMKDIKENIERAINSDNRNIIAYYREDVLYGVCIYMWLHDENYAQTEVFVIREDYEKIADDFIGYISAQLPGYELFVGVSADNKNANQYFTKKNVECTSSCIVTELYDLKPPMNQNHDKVEKITKSNFEEYALFHDKFAIPLEMYYNSPNLLKDIERFRIFAFNEGEEIHGGIFVKILKDSFEVFGLFVDEEYENKGIHTILMDEMLVQLYNEFGAVKEITYFIDEDCTTDLNSALTAGFEIKDRYKCYKYKL